MVIARRLPIRASARAIVAVVCSLYVVGCGSKSPSPAAPSAATAPNGATFGNVPAAGGFGTASRGSSTDFAACLSGQVQTGCFSAAAMSARALLVGAAVPAAPGTLTASVSGSTVSLVWSAPSSGDAPTSYVLEAGTATGLANLANSSTGNTSTTYVANGVGAGTYYVRVRAQNASGVSAPTNEVTVVVGSVGGCTAAPNAPTNLATTVTGGTVSLSWSAPVGGCAPTSYVLQAGSSTGSSNLANSNVGNLTSYSASGVGTGSYYIRVRAQNGAGQSAASNEVVATVGGSLFMGHIAGSPTTDATVVAVALDTDGSRVSAVAGTGGVDGIVAGTYMTPGGQESLVYLRSDGMPALAVSGGSIIVFDNYTATTMDIAIITSSGQITVTRGISLASVGLTGADRVPLALGRPATGFWGKVLKVIAIAIKGAGCALIGTTGAGLPLTIACSARVINDIRTMATGNEIDPSKDALGIAATGADCAASAMTQDAIGLLACVVNGRKIFISQADSNRKSRQPDIDRAITTIRTPTTPTDPGGIIGFVGKGECKYFEIFDFWTGCKADVTVRITVPVTSDTISAFIFWNTGGGDGLFHGHVLKENVTLPGTITISTTSGSLFRRYCSNAIPVIVEIVDGAESTISNPKVLYKIDSTWTGFGCG